MKKITIKSPFDQSIVGEVSFFSLQNVKDTIDIAYNHFKNYDNRLKIYQIVNLLIKLLNLYTSSERITPILN